MKELATFIEIDAKPDVVWQHAADFRRYAEWNPFITAIDGDPVVGAKIRVTMRLKTPDGRNEANHVVTPRIVKVEDEFEIRWEHGAWFPGLLNIEHWFRITQRKGGVKFHQCMRVEGLIALALKDDYFVMFRDGFAAMNAALKRRVETLQPPQRHGAPIANDNAGRGQPRSGPAAAAGRI
jgi:hypothetical protein